MEKDKILKYKLILSQDLISFITKLYLSKVPIENKARCANFILDAWEKSVTEVLDKSINPLVKATSSEQMMEEDVQRILIDIFRIEPDLIREEFKNEIRNQLFRVLTQENK